MSSDSVLASRWETFLASVMAVFSASDESFSAWLQQKGLFIGNNMRVYRGSPPSCECAGWDKSDGFVRHCKLPAGHPGPCGF